MERGKYRSDFKPFVWPESDLVFLHLSYLTQETAVHKDLQAESPSTSEPARLPKEFANQWPGEKKQQKGIWEQQKCGRLRLPGPTREAAFIEYLQPNILCVPLPTAGLTALAWLGRWLGKNSRGCRTTIADSLRAKSRHSFPSLKLSTSSGAQPAIPRYNLSPCPHLQPQIHGK